MLINGFRPGSLLALTEVSLLSFQRALYVQSALFIFFFFLRDRHLASITQVNRHKIANWKIANLLISSLDIDYCSIIPLFSTTAGQIYGGLCILHSLFMCVSLKNPYIVRLNMDYRVRFESYWFSKLDKIDLYPGTIAPHFPLARTRVAFALRSWVHSCIYTL